MRLARVRTAVARRASSLIIASGAAATRKTLDERFRVT
jgi:hypothetical protein